jgi:hypothetical protein
LRRDAHRRSRSLCDVPSEFPHAASVILELDEAPIPLQAASGAGTALRIYPKGGLG